jgi:hypothetical protein
LSRILISNPVSSLLLVLDTEERDMCKCISDSASDSAPFPNLSNPRSLVHLSSYKLVSQVFTVASDELCLA